MPMKAVTFVFFSIGLAVWDDHDREAFTCQNRQDSWNSPPVNIYEEIGYTSVLETRPKYINYIEQEYAFGIVADLDLQSRDPQEFLWRSYLRKGRLVRVSKRGETDRFNIEFDEELELKSSTATRNRSMELSELIRFKRLLLAFCDSSGIVYKLDPNTGKVFSRWALADGNGNEPKPFKTEWATLKDNTLWVGSVGFEWYSPDGTVLHRNAEWVKTVDSGGLIHNLDWHPVYQAIRTITNTTLPGYLWHEAVEWDPMHRRWIMLPRFGSTTSKYTPNMEPDQTVNILIVADEGFTDIQMKWLQHHDQRFGFTSIRKLPGSPTLFMLLRVREEGAEHETQAAVIDLDGVFYTDPPYIDVGYRKFEGLAFL